MAQEKKGESTYEGPIKLQDISNDLGLNQNKIKGSNSQIDHEESNDLVESELEDNESMTNDTIAKNIS